jgi:8-oxo-dGTP diphosphatase / 2-hydroxy-dATP diphosphatase
MSEQSKKQMTLLVVEKNGRVLLGMKKRGFGAGRWNGFGGKVDPNETIDEAARREVKEEAGIEVNDIEKIGVIDFEFQGKPGILEVNIYKATNFSGEPTESDEMKPQWFDIDKIPFSEMWPDDIYWFPLFLAGKKFKGRFLFGEGDSIIEQELEAITGI